MMEMLAQAGVGWTFSSFLFPEEKQSRIDHMIALVTVWLCIGSFFARLERIVDSDVAILPLILLHMAVIWLYTAWATRWWLTVYPRTH